jgi:isopropylmalate/homocitrate/citramalate synthase
MMNRSRDATGARRQIQSRPASKFIHPPGTAPNAPIIRAITEEGPRKGFQIEKGPIPTARKVELIDALSETGLTRIQVASFVSRKQVPGMADADDSTRNLIAVDSPALVLRSSRMLASSTDAVSATTTRAINLSLMPHEHPCEPDVPKR